MREHAPDLSFFTLVDDQAVIKGSGTHLFDDRRGGNPILKLNAKLQVLFFTG